MTTIRFGAMAAGACLLAACGGMLSEDEQTDVVAYYTTLAAADTEPAKLYPDLTFQIFRQLVSKDSFPADRIGLWGEDDYVKSKVAELYADYIDDVEDTIVGGVKAKLDYRELAALDELRKDEAKLATAKCAVTSEAVEWADKWSGCAGEGTGLPTSEEKSAFEKLINALPGVLGSETSLTYFGGTTCKLFADFQQDVSRDGFSITLEDIKLNLGDSDKVECDTLRDRLVDLRTERNPGKVIVR